MYAHPHQTLARDRVARPLGAREASHLGAAQAHALSKAPTSERGISRGLYRRDDPQAPRPRRAATPTTQTAPSRPHAAQGRGIELRLVRRLQGRVQDARRPLLLSADGHRCPQPLRLVLSRAALNCAESSTALLRAPLPQTRFAPCHRHRQWQVRYAGDLRAEQNGRHERMLRSTDVPLASCRRSCRSLRIRATGRSSGSQSVVRSASRAVSCSLARRCPTSGSVSKRLPTASGRCISTIDFRHVWMNATTSCILENVSPIKPVCIVTYHLGSYESRYIISKIKGK